MIKIYSDGVKVVTYVRLARKNLTLAAAPTLCRLEGERALPIMTFFQLSFSVL